MRQETEPSPEDLKKFNKHEEALEEFGRDLKRGLSESDEEFGQEKEKTIEELGGETVEENKGKKSKKEMIH
jgi:hypothetical protein